MGRKNSREKSSKGKGRGAKVELSFAKRCYQLIRRVPSGRVTTYREIAGALGTRAYQAVGQALKRNPDAPEVPCHRVVQSDGGLGGYAGGRAKKISLLRAEGVACAGGRIKDFSTVLFSLAAKQ